MPRLTFLTKTPIWEHRAEDIPRLLADLPWRPEDGYTRDAGDYVLWQDQDNPKNTPGHIRFDGTQLETGGAEAQIDWIALDLGRGWQYETVGIELDQMTLPLRSLERAGQQGPDAVASLLAQMDWETRGTSGGDWIGPYLWRDSNVTFDGDDLWYGYHGDDRLDAGDGQDTLRGGVGDDTLVGGGGADHLYGGPGADLLDGRAGEQLSAGGGNRLWGGAGDDKLLASAGTDTLRGGPGADTLVGYEFSDTLRGGAGNDLIYATRSDQVSPFLVFQRGPHYGGPGDDTIHAGGGVVTGGPGADVFVPSQPVFDIGRVTDFKPGVDVLAFEDRFQASQLHSPTVSVSETGQDLYVYAYSASIKLIGVASEDFDVERDIVWI